MTLKLTQMRVLQVLPQLNDGGVEQSTIDMAEYLKKKHVYNAVASAGGRHQARLKELKIPHVTLNLVSKNPLRWFIYALRLRHYITTHRINIVHARSRAPAYVAWWAVRKLPGVKFITTYHGTYGHQNIFKRWYNRIMFKGPLVIANSQFIAQHIQQIYGVSPQRIVAAPRGVQPRQFNPANITPGQVAQLRSQLNIEPNHLMLLFVGRLTSWKGQHVLLEALGKLPKNAKYVAVFAGGPDKTGTYAKDLYGFAQRIGLSHKVRWLGSRTDIPLLNAAADVAFNLSTRPEAFGRTTVEAMAMGTPVVASAQGGSLEIVQHGQTGWLVAANQPQPVAKWIRSFLTRPALLASVGAAARAHVLAHFTVAQCCGAELKAYGQLWSSAQEDRPYRA